MENNEQRAEKDLPFTLRRFHISEDFGFLLPDPLKELPPFYSPWMEIAHKLPYLIENHQLRSHVNKMPLLSSQYLQGHRELYLAHLVLSCITMGYVWQEGERGTAKILPRNLAIPFGEVSQLLGLPPILVHMDFVLANWKKRNPYGPVEIENLDPIVWLPGGPSLRGFVLVTFLVEKAAVPGIKAVPEIVSGLLRPDNQLLEEGLQDVTNSLRDMCSALKKMHDYVDPAIFYCLIRIFLSGWKDNPALPGGLMYEGVCDTPLSYTGGSAAQSTTLQAFDELLGIQHDRRSTVFLHGMREYMPPHHRDFIREIQSVPPLRNHVLASGSEALRSAYNECVAALVDLRSYHIVLVTKYITVAAHNAKAKVGESGVPGTPPSFLESRGTGGSGVLSFLKSVRDTTKEALIPL